MITIFKYPLKVEDAQVIKIHKWSQVLCVQVQNGVPCLWAVVNSENELVDKTIFTIGTGGPFPGSTKTVYIGTYQLPDLGLVFHVFEDKAQKIAL